MIANLENKTGPTSKHLLPEALPEPPRNHPGSLWRNLGSPRHLQSTKTPGANERMVSTWLHDDCTQQTIPILPYMFQYIYSACVYIYIYLHPVRVPVLEQDLFPLWYTPPMVKTRPYHKNTSLLVWDHFWGFLWTHLMVVFWSMLE